MLLLLLDSKEGNEATHYAEEGLKILIDIEVIEVVEDVKGGPKVWKLVRDCTRL